MVIKHSQKCMFSNRLRLNISESKIQFDFRVPYQPKVYDARICYGESKIFLQIMLKS